MPAIFFPRTVIDLCNRVCFCEYATVHSFRVFLELYCLEILLHMYSSYLHAMQCCILIFIVVVVIDHIAHMIYKESAFLSHHHS